MKVILSTELEDNYTNFAVVKDFKSIDPSMVDVLVIHKFNESDFDAGLAITDLNSRGLAHFVYISSNISLVIKTSIIGVGGSVYEDEFYFEDEDELLGLLEEIGIEDESNSLVLSSAQLVKDFIEAFSRGDKKIQAPLYLEQVNNAISELSDLTHKQELQITEMGESAIDVFKRASSVINSMEDSKKMLQKQLDEFEEKVSTQVSKQSSFSSSAIMFFPTFKYNGITTKVLTIKEYSPCRYLTSFLLAYIHYLHYDKNKKVKLVITYQKGKNIASKYTGFTVITQESMNKTELYYDEIIATNNPKSDVMKKLTSQGDDIVIVLDRLYGQPIISGRVKTLNAVSGLSDIDRFKLKPDSCIFTITKQATEFFHIPLIKGYAKETDMRFAAYAQVCKEQFKKLDDLIISR